LGVPRGAGSWRLSVEAWGEKSRWERSDEVGRRKGAGKRGWESNWIPVGMELESGRYFSRSVVKNVPAGGRGLPAVGRYAGAPGTS
jgi:hypothetical protein